MRLTRAGFAGGLASSIVLGPALARAQTTPPFRKIFYENDGLRLESYLYVPPAAAALRRLVVYNHGSRVGHEREEVFFSYIASFLVPMGYAVFVPERRGYGLSQGETYSEAVTNVSQQIPRLEKEATDVLAGVSFIAGFPELRGSTVSLMGWSLGGIVSLMAAAREPQSFCCVIDQAGGAESWNANPALRTLLPARALQFAAPLYAMDAENDATTSAVAAVADARTGRVPQLPVKLTVYQPFFPPAAQQQQHPTVPPGHLIFSETGVSIWERDVLDFLNLTMSH